MESHLNTKEEIIDQKQSDVGLICLRKDGIITFEPLPGKITHTLPAIQYELSVFQEWSKDTKRGFISDNRELKKFEDDIRGFVKQNLPLFCNKFALVIKPGISAFLTKMFIHINRPSIPTKTFKTFEEALRWMKQE